MFAGLKRQILLYATAMLVLTLFPQSAQAQAQSSIAGVVTDATGGALPGVTIEASSPALIERIRSVVTDERGQYRIVDLRPGTYAVKFTLTGFGAVVREGVELSSGFTATIDAELKVGGVEETITVSGQSPLVDVQGTQSQHVITSDVLQNIPGNRGYASFIDFTPGFTQAPAAHDVGGTQSEILQEGMLWGSRGSDFQIQIDGMNASTLLGVGRSRGLMLNGAIAQETNVSVGNATAEHEVAGTLINVIPKDGGNTVSGVLYFNGTDNALQSDNLSDELRSRGLTQVNTIKNIWDLNGTAGGPLRKNRLWLFGGVRYWGRERYMAGNYWNKTQGTPFYTPDPTRRVTKDNTNKDLTVRLTWQAAKQHRFRFTQINEDVTFLEQIDNVPISPEAAPRYNYTVDYVSQLSWTAPMSDSMLLEGAVQVVDNHYPIAYQPGVTSSDISILEQSTGYRYNAWTNYGDYGVDHVVSRFGVSRITGAHAFKTGVQMQSGRKWSRATVNEGLRYEFLNQTPTALTQHISPFSSEERLRLSMGLFAQDRWTLRRITLNLGVRYDYFNSYVPAQEQAATRFLPAFSFAEVADVPSWHDVSPRLGAAYDLFGSGKTAIKGSIGRYVLSESLRFATSNNPLNTVVTSVARTWDDGDRDYRPDCDLLNPDANGECGAFQNRAFGQPRVLTRPADEIRSGFGVRPYNWLFTAELEHELLPTTSVKISYARRWYGNFTIVDNLEVGPTDFSPYSITAPLDPRLPGGGGYPVTGLYDVNPAKFGRFNNLIRPASDFGNQTETSDFINLTMTARLRNGALISGGLDTGRTVADRCFVVDSPQELRHCRVEAPFASQTQVKVLGVYPLPWDARVSANWQNLSVLPYFAVTSVPVTSSWAGATYVATNALIAPSLGRNLSAGSSGFAVVELLDPLSVLGDRLNQVDVRLAKTFRRGRSRIEAQFDVYNVLNGSTVLTQNTRYGPTWLRPIQILEGRFIKFGAQLTF